MPSPAFGTAVTMSDLFTFGDPYLAIHIEGRGPVNLISTPGMCNDREQSFEEARLRHYKFRIDATGANKEEALRLLKLAIGTTKVPSASSDDGKGSPASP